MGCYCFSVYTEYRLVGNLIINILIGLNSRTILKCEDLLELIVEYHKDNERQGPGSKEATLKALSYILYLNEKTKILELVVDWEVIQ